MVNFVLKAFGTAPRSLLGALLMVASVGAAQAVPAFTITNTTGSTLVNPPFTLGWQFSTTGSIKVTQLGLFDDAQDGLVESHELGIWNAAGTLLASATVAAGTGDPLVNQFRYVDITDLLLGAGTYRVGALFATGADPIVFDGEATGFATAGGITYLNSSFAAGGTLADPSVAAGTVSGYFGPNFLFDAAVAVPEPGSLALLAAGVLALARRRRPAGPRA